MLILILTTSLGCTSNVNKDLSYLANNTDYCSQDNIICEDVVMKYDFGKLNVSKKASCLSESDYMNMYNYILGGGISPHLEYRGEEMIFQVECESKIINLVSLN